MEGIENQIRQVVDTVLEDYCHERDVDRIDLRHQPDKDCVIDMIAKLRRIVFPGCAGAGGDVRRCLSVLIEEVTVGLGRQIGIVLGSQERGVQIALEFLRTVPRVRATVQTDLEAAFEGDPAASSIDEIVFSYPGVLAVTVYRLAHELSLLGVPMIPRIMTEYAHSVTGIDIHPGACIGKYFFIDHGTGTVIGETTVIGERVKIYQGVTLGGLSTRGGQSLRGQKRHPTVGDRVTVYANASILGGETVIGAGSVIGANVFVTHSVPPCTTVTVKCRELRMRPGGNCRTEENRDV